MFTFIKKKKYFYITEDVLECVFTCNKGEYKDQSINPFGRKQ